MLKLFNHNGVFFCVGTERPALKYLNRYVRDDITGKWHDIGVELFDVEDERKLNTIKIDYSRDTNKCTAEMLLLWLERKDASWNRLLEALRAPNIKLEALASKIEGMLIKGHTVMHTYTNTHMAHTNTHAYKHTHKHMHKHTHMVLLLDH